jgi:protein-tyrosine phosphatase
VDHSPRIASVPNLRDLGGYSTHDGRRVRTGLVYRSGQLDRLDGDDARAFARLGIRSVYDLRTEHERTKHPDQLPPGTRHVVVDVLADLADAAPARLERLISDPKAAGDALGNGKATELFTYGYRVFVSFDSARAAYRRLFTGLADGANRPALFHCTAGKDRAGWAAAALLLLLGVSDDLVMHDFLLSNRYVLPAYQSVLDAFELRGGDPRLLQPLLGVQEAYLSASLDEVRHNFGSIEDYFATGLGIDEARQRALRATFVEPALDG